MDDPLVQQARKGYPFLTQSDKQGEGSNSATRSKRGDP
jgi:hypothetical protein